MERNRKSKKIDMQKATVITTQKKNRSRIRITSPNGKGKPKTVILEFRTQDALDIFGDAVMGLLEDVEYDPIDETH